MKRCGLGIIIVLLLCTMAYAVAIKRATITVLNAATYTEIVNEHQSCSNFAVFTEDGTAFTYAIDSAGLGAAVCPADTIISFPNSVPSGDTVMWVKASAGTPNFVFQPGK